MKKNNHNTQKAAIIGSGIGGLGSALRLRAKGFEVKVYEKGKKPGGKMNQFSKDGFRFDMGPSLFTMPSQVDDLFTLFGENPRDHFHYDKVELTCRYFWEDGSMLNAWQDSDRLAGEIELMSGVAPGVVKDFFKKSKRLYDITAEVFLYNSLHKARNFFKPVFLKSMLFLHEIDAFVFMHDKNRRWFSDPRIVQVFDRYATYNGSNPYKTPATLNVIAHLEHNMGAAFPRGGMYQIAQSLYELALRQGIEFVFDTPVEEILLEKKAVKGLKVKGKEQEYDLVVSNLDIVNTYKHLLPGEKVPISQIKAERSTSALIFYWGINREFPELDLHNILFSENYKEEFDHLFNHKSLYEDPTVYIFISKKFVASDAPRGMENWFVMINTPENVGQNWDEYISQARVHIKNKINRILKTRIEEHILFEEQLNPISIETRTGSYHGSLYGPSSNSPFSAFMRHPNFKRKYKNLYFSGGSVHPGGGVPLCLASAKIIADEA